MKCSETYLTASRFGTGQSVQLIVCQNHSWHKNDQQLNIYMHEVEAKATENWKSINSEESFIELAHNDSKHEMTSTDANDINQAKELTPTAAAADGQFAVTQLIRHKNWNL